MQAISPLIHRDGWESIIHLPPVPAPVQSEQTHDHQENAINTIGEGNCPHPLPRWHFSPKLPMKQIQPTAREINS